MVADAKQCCRLSVCGGGQCPFALCLLLLMLLLLLLLVSLFCCGVAILLVFWYLLLLLLLLFLFTSDCINRFTVGEGRSAGGGEQHTEFTNLQDCLDACVEIDDCVAVDTDVGSFSCWFHLDEANLASTADRIGVNQHVLARCVPPSGM